MKTGLIKFWLISVPAAAVIQIEMRNRYLFGIKSDKMVLINQSIYLIIMNNIGKDHIFLALLEILNFFATA